MKRPILVYGLCLLAVAVGAMAIRLPRLSMRPMHPDEANQAARTGRLLDTGAYAYDPAAHHGPTLYYLTLPSLRLSGASCYAESDETAYRIVPVIFGVGTILLLLLMGGGLGWPATVVAAGLAALSPAMVYYSRYYIQEMLLVFFTLAAIAAGWRYARGGSAVWAVAAGAMIGLMHATKETWVLAAAAMVGGLVLTVLWTRWCGNGPSRPTLLRRGLWPVFAGAAAAGLVATAFYSSFGTNWSGPLDSLRAYGSYLHTAGDPVHVHPWYYYLALLVWNHPTGFFWSEGLIVGLALAGAVAALAGRGVKDAHLPLVRFLAFYTVLVTLFYSAIPYKTPWCILTALSGMTLLAGVGAMALVRGLRRWPLQLLAVVVLAVLVAHLAWQSYWLNGRFAADTRNPYVYAHASSDVLALARQMEQWAAVSPAGHDLLIRVCSSDNYWPLPWYLRKFNRVGYWSDAADLPAVMDADVLLLTGDWPSAVEDRLRRSYNRPGARGLRPGVLVSVYVEQGLWEAYLAAQAAAALKEPSP
jgi:uncharacterized protein (TIGR03663 family)